MRRPDEEVLRKNHETAKKNKKRHFDRRNRTSELEQLTQGDKVLIQTPDDIDEERAPGDT